MNGMTKRIPKDKNPLTAPSSVLLFATYWVYPQEQGQDPESLAIKNIYRHFIQATVNKATAKGCKDWQRWLSDLASPLTQTRFIAANELVSHLTYAELNALSGDFLEKESPHD